MKVMVLGCAACVYEDAEKALELFTPDLIVAVNHIGTVYPKVDHWASCHIDLFPQWVLERASNDLPAAQLWTNETKIPNLSPAQKAMSIKGAPYCDTSSGGLGIDVAVFGLKADKVVVCGVPLENGPHFYEGEQFTWQDPYRYKWTHNMNKWGDKVRSLSGWTRTQLSYPTPEWLDAV